MTRPSFLPSLTAVLILSVTLVARAEDWPQWRGVRSDGSWNGPKLPEKLPDGGFPVVWKKPIAAGYSGIAVADGRVYTLDRPTPVKREKKDAPNATDPTLEDATPLPPESERVLCLDAKSGRVLWSHAYAVKYGDLDYGKGPRSTPTIRDGRVYTLGAVGHLHCLDAVSGKEIWAHDLVASRGAKLPTWGLAASPVIFGDLVIVHPGCGKGGCFLAFDRKSGREIWSGGDDPAGYATPLLVRHAGRDLLVGWTPENIVGLDPAKGRVLWSIPYKVTYGVSIATPIYRDGIVLVCGYWDGSKAIRLGEKPEQAEILWEDSKTFRGLMSQPLYRDGKFYLLDKTLGVVCGELTTGNHLWSDQNQLTKRDRNPQVNLMWLGDRDRFLALNAEGEMIVGRLTPARMQEDYRAKIIGPTWAHPALAGDCLFARDDSEIVCLRIGAK